uniref:Rieske domain-containing protein n=1 Tax=Leptobrachium leishanense TaxID=445787 RepID=A0A8C5ME00_9ANUR
MEGFREDLVTALKEVVSNTNWQCVGEKERFKSPCTKLYSEDGEDVILIHTENDKFYAMDAACPHEGGPLELGDIEELGNGRLAISCPWHDFEFCLDDGSSSSGLQNHVYEVNVYDGKVYVQTQNTLALAPWKATQCKQTATIEAVTPSPCLEEEKLSLCYWASRILQTADPEDKANLTQEVQALWNAGKILEIGHTPPPSQPSRKENLTIVQPGKIKRGKGGTLASRIALLHSLANIEQWAIDLSWDIIARFAEFRMSTGEALPREFFSDFVKVAGDEAKHYRMLEARLLELGSNFGVLPVHNGLWQSAADTAHDLLARLAIVHMVHEARGLDVHPQTLQRFSAQGDGSSVEVLEVIYTDEITHVAAGIKWFTFICSKEKRNCLSTFHELVPLYFKGYLKPPFNSEGRRSAGMSEET